MSDTIRVRGVSATGFHGVFDHEKRDGQRFVVDVDLRVDLARAGASDDLNDTLSYADVASQVVARIEGEPFDLIEALAEVIAADALADPRVDDVRVVVHKPQAPVGVDFEDVAVEIARTRPEVPVVIAVGANLPRGEDAPAETVLAAAARLAALPEMHGVRLSDLVETDPVGGPPDQPRYVNAVALAATRLSPYSLLAALNRIEAAFDRVRAQRWGPRTLDLDLVSYGEPDTAGEVVLGTDSLTLPHPRAAERSFVLAPWNALDPRARLRTPGGVREVAALLADVGTHGVHPLAGVPAERGVGA